MPKITATTEARIKELLLAGRDIQTVAKMADASVTTVRARRWQYWGLIKIMQTPLMEEGTKKSKAT